MRRRRLLVLPDTASAEVRQAERLAEQAGRVLDGRDIIAAARFRQDLLAAALPGVAPLSQVAERHLLRAVLAEAADADPALGRLRHRGRLPQGLVAAAARALQDCRGAEARPGQLVATGPDGARLGHLLERWERRLDALDAVDAASLPARLADAVAAGAPLPRALVAEPVWVELEGTFRYTAAEVRLLEALAARLAATGGGVRVVLPGSMAEGGAFAWLVSVKRLFEAGGAEGQVDLAEALPAVDLDRASGPAAAAAAFLPAPPPPGAGARPPQARLGGLEVVSAPDAAAEAREVARRVRERVAAGMAPEDIVVAARRLGGEALALADALADMGLPVDDRRGRPVQAVGPVRLLLDLLRLAREHLARDGLVSLFGSRYVAVGAAGVPGRALIRWLRRAGAVDDLGEGYVPAVRKAAAAASRPGAPPDPEGLRVADRLGEVLPTLSALGRAGTVTEHVDRLRRAEASLGLRAGVQAVGARLLAGEGAGPLAGAALEAVARDEAALAALDAALDDCLAVADRLGEADRVLGAAAFQALLGDALDARTLRAAALRGGAVRLLGAEDLAPQRCRALFLMGLADGAFPARAEEDPLLPDATRRRLNAALGRPAFPVMTEHDRGEGDAPARRAEEALLFALALHLPTDHLCLSFARTSDTGRPAVASPYLAEVESRLGLRRTKVALAPVPAVPGAGVPGAGQDAPVAPEAATPADLEVALAGQIYGAPPSLPGAFPVPRPLPAGVEAALAAGSVRLRRLVAPLAVERARHRFFLDAEVAPGAHTGAVGPLPERLSARLDAGAGRPLSVTQLERLARCGFQAFAGRALGLEAPERRDETLDPLSRGQLLHACLERAWVALDGAGLLPLTPARREAAREAADAAARGVVASWPETGHAGDPALFALEAEVALETVGRLVDTECEADAGWALEATELSFGDGAGGWPALALPDPGDPGRVHHLRGRLDRLDRRAGPGGVELRVLDYKSGGAAGLRSRLYPEVLGHTELQLPAYLAATRARFPGAGLDAGYVALGDRPPTHTVVSEALASTRGKWKGLDVDVPALLDGDGERPGLAARVAELLAAVRQGALPPRPIDGACTWCELADVCRVVVPAGSDEEGGS